MSDRTIREDRAVPEVHHTMTTAGAKPQVSGPDEFSAPTDSNPGPDKQLAALDATLRLWPRPVLARRRGSYHRVRATYSGTHGDGTRAAAVLGTNSSDHRHDERDRSRIGDLRRQTLRSP
jgi:hypothetical protein